MPSYSFKGNEKSFSIEFLGELSQTYTFFKSLALRSAQYPANSPLVYNGNTFFLNFLASWLNNFTVQLNSRD